MPGNIYIKRSFVYLLPLIFVVWVVVLMHGNGCYHLFTIDPGYPYLINGLNVANLNFDRIGHVDHPGTPFQILTAIFLHFTHFIAGNDSLVNDVIARPDFYLTMSIFYLTLINALVILWIGKTVYKITESYLGTIIIQSSLFIHIYIIQTIPTYIPELLIIILVLIYVWVIFRYFYDDSINNSRFAIYSGIILGIATLTKIIFIPIIIIPLILIKPFRDKIIFLSIFISSGLLLFLPIWSKHPHFRNFIFGLFIHDGLYGAGNPQIINWNYFTHNIVLILKENLSFTITLILAICITALLFLYPALRKKFKNESSMLILFILISFIGIAMVAKHYKNHYMVPFIAFSGFTLYLIWRILRNSFPFKFWNSIFSVGLSILTLMTLTNSISRNNAKINLHHTNHFLADYCRSNISCNDYLLIEPSWLPGPLPVYGLIFGFSFSAKNYLYYNNIEKYYPNIITWKDEFKKLKFFRMIDAEIESILKSGKNIYILSTPGRNAPLLCQYLDDNSNKLGVKLKKDTVFSNIIKNEYLLKYSNISDWNTVASVCSGFEKTQGNHVITDDGIIQLTGEFVRSKEQSYQGIYSIELSKQNNSSPVYNIPNVSKGDYLEVTIKHSSLNETTGKLVVQMLNVKTDACFTTKFYMSPEIKPGWILERINIEITKETDNDTLICYFLYDGDEKMFIDDFSYKHYKNQ